MENKYYLEKLRDPRWQKCRLKIMERDGFSCVDCGSKDRTMHVHHLKYIKGFDPWDYDEKDMETLCEDCHKQKTILQKGGKLLVQYLESIGYEGVDFLYLQFLIEQRMRTNSLKSIQRALSSTLLNDTVFSLSEEEFNNTLKEMRQKNFKTN